MTARQFDVWETWLQNEWNKPSRTDHYLMKLIACWGKEGATEEDCRIKFEFKEAPPPKSSSEIAAERERVDAQFAELKAAGYHVPRRLTKEDMEQNVVKWQREFDTTFSKEPPSRK